MKISLFLSLFFSLTSYSSDCVQVYQYKTPFSEVSKDSEPVCYNDLADEKPFTLSIISATWCRPCETFAKNLSEEIKKNSLPNLTVRVNFGDRYTRDSIEQKVSGGSYDPFYLATDSIFGEESVRDILGDVEDNLLQVQNEGKLMVELQGLRGYPSMILTNSNEEVVFISVGYAENTIDEIIRITNL